MATAAGQKLWSAARSGNLAECTRLLGAGVPVDSITSDRCASTPLSTATCHGHAAVVGLLLQNDARVDTRDVWDNTPLTYAAANSHATILELLLAEGASPQNANDSGSTPPMLAAKYRHVACLRALLLSFLPCGAAV